MQVISLMWLRTALNYQYRYGTSTTEALKTLYAAGGIPRLYQGLPFAILQGPLSRFGDTAANTLLMSLLDAVDPTGAVYPLSLRTALGSITAGVWRILLMPIDTAKTCMQVNGKQGLPQLRDRIVNEGPGVLFNGAIAASAATAVGHFPWFFTYNYLTSHLPTPEQYITALQATAAVSKGPMQNVPQLLTATDPVVLDLLRSAFIGLCASSVSDVASNSLRVLKTTKQTLMSSADSGSSSSSSSVQRNDENYLQIARRIVAAEGIEGLLGRGLQTRLLANALQGMLFSVLFKYFQQRH